MLIGVDIDNVVAEFEAAFRGWINRHTGLALRRSDITTFSFADCCPLSHDEVADLFWGFVRAGRLRSLSLIPHARSALEGLSRRSEVCLVTSRPPQEEIVADTRFWCQRKGLGFARLIFAERKWETDEDFSLFVEDNLDQAVALAERGTAVLLLDYPWNRAASPHPRISRIRSWQAARDLLAAP
jgi:uncharacterized HAD superfamily protein